MAITAVYAGFKTGWNQREVRIDAKPATDLKVGQLCTYNSSTHVLSAKTSDAFAVGDVIIAQSDMTIAHGHADVEHHDYSYDDKVAASTSAEKAVMVFFVTDPSDIVKTGQVGSAT